MKIALISVIEREKNIETKITIYDSSTGRLLEKIEMKDDPIRQIVIKDSLKIVKGVVEKKMYFTVDDFKQVRKKGEIILID